MLLDLNPDQRTAANSINGDFVVIAGPGSGKTAMTIQRFLEMITTHGIPQKDILNLTFTNSAASEMVSRVGMLDVDKVFRTFHAFALDLLQRERANLPFQLCDTIIPVRGEKFQLLKDLMKIYPPITTFRSLSDKIEEWQCANIEPKRAIEEAYNTKGTAYFYAAAYADYEKKCREQGWLDFHGLITESVKLLETNPEVRERNKKKYLAVDECQDTDVVQFRLLQLISGGNVFVVGDENQCQPPGSLVDVLVSPKKGRVESQVEQVPIEELSETNDKLVSWDHHAKRIRLGSGRRFRRAVRHFDGSLLEIESNGKITKVTPNHFLWVKFNRELLKKKTHFVYLMWRRNLGFRIGTSSLKTSSGSNQISHRGYQEKADKMWVLEVTDSGTEARTREEILSLQYQIPERVYESEVLSKEQTWRVFHSVSERGGFEILKSKGLLFEHPLVSWTRRREKHLTKFHGYFKTVAANVIEGLMDLPTKQSYESSIISKVKKVEYHGPVYSLEVEKDHTYIADGIPVGNCIYEWRSAQSGNLSNFSRVFPGARTLYLGQNYRSTQKLVAFFKKIIPVDNGLASHMVSMREEGTDPTFTKFGDDIEEASVVLKCITDPADSAVIARTNRQLMTFQKKCMGLGIKSRVLGKKNVWEQNEVRHLLELTKEQGSGFGNRPAHEVMKELMETHNLSYVYRNSGSPLEKDPIENLNDIIRMSAKRGTVSEFLEWLRKLTYGAKSDKKPMLSLTTVHQAKGREWKHVFVIGAQQGMMPHKDGELLEEHRIFFVACTRAADTLDISFVGSPSQFLNDFKEEIEIYGEKSS